MTETRPGVPEAGRPREKTTEDERLLESPDSLLVAKDSWRIFRIMGEFVEGYDELAGLGPAVTVFGSARTPPDHPMYQLCVNTARKLGEAGFAIITGGGPGMMEAANRGAREAGVRSVGCNIELPFEQGTNPYVDTSVNFRYFFVRKTMFIKYAHGFVILPGGFGTMDELFESLTLIQTGKVRNFPVVMVGVEYWSGLLDWLKTRMLLDGNISEDDLGLIKLTDDPDEVVAHVLANRDAGMLGGLP